MTTDTPEMAWDDEGMRIERAIWERRQYQRQILYMTARTRFGRWWHYRQMLKDAIRSEPIRAAIRRETGR